MSRNLYDPSNDTLSPLAGYQSVDSALSSTSGNPVSNRVVKAALDGKANASTVASQIQTLTNQVSNKADTASVISNVYEVTTPAFSSLPQTFTAQGITANHNLVVDGFAFLSNPSAQGSDWTVTTGANTIKISGTFSGSTATTVTMTLGVKRSITATT